MTDHLRPVPKSEQTRRGSGRAKTGQGRTAVLKTRRDPRYMGFIRTQTCICCGTCDFVEAAHTDTGGASMKGDDRRTIPLCADCHRLRDDSWHGLGSRDAFEEVHQISCAVEIQRLNGIYQRAHDRAAERRRERKT